jgi:hypothetical protein
MVFPVPTSPCTKAPRGAGGDVGAGGRLSSTAWAVEVVVVLVVEEEEEEKEEETGVGERRVRVCFM